MLNKNFSPFYVETSLTSPAQGNVSTVANIVMKGKTVYTVPAILASAPEAKIDESRSDALFNWEDSVTFAVGPIPLTVEFGANGKAGASVNLRNSNMWSNGRGVPFADLNGFANAAVDLWIAKAGIEAQIKFVALALDNYAFSGALYNGAEKGFYHSSQLSAQQQLKALEGNLSAFAKVRVPRADSRLQSTNIFLTNYKKKLIPLHHEAWLQRLKWQVNFVC